jgi:hypothetical protein
VVAVSHATRPCPDLLLAPCNQDVPVPCMATMQRCVGGLQCNLRPCNTHLEWARHCNDDLRAPRDGLQRLRLRDVAQQDLRILCSAMSDTIP